MEIAEKYILSVYNNRSFSLAAKELFISQPALSASISRHEKAIGFSIFDRSVIPVALTEKGKIYVEYLEDKERGENELSRKLELLSEKSTGEITVGAYAYSAYSFLGTVCGKFSKDYPNVKVKLDMGNVGHISILSEKLSRHELDIMLNYSFDPKEHNATPILREKMVIAMHRDLEGAESISHLAIPRDKILKGEWSENDLIEDTSIFSDIKFLQYSPYSDTLMRMKVILGKYKISNYSVKNVRQVSMHNRLMVAGIAAIMTTDYHLRNGIFDNNDLLFFLPKGDMTYRTLYLIRQKERQISSAAESFIETAKLFKIE